MSQLSVEPKNTHGEQDRLGHIVKDQGFCQTFENLILFIKIDKCSDSYHKAAL